MDRRSFLFSPALALLAQSSTRRQISGIYPHLAMFNSENECGTGAVVPWAGKLWVVTYSPHKPAGSDDRLYEIDSQLQQTIRKESIGGTPANRMIHRESDQLFIGPYAIDAKGGVRTIPYSVAYGRPTGNARHLTDPAGKIYLATMEEGFYEIDVRSLAVKQLYEDANLAVVRKTAKDITGPLLPGYHGKGFYSGQGRTVYSNNGEVGGGNLPPDTPSGCLAEWDGKDWKVVRRNQFTEVTGPGGISGNTNPSEDPIWAVGWDHRSVILMLLDHGTWHTYRLPKATHTYDGAHGWNTEWPRIREIGEQDLLMTMHGMFWRFPKTFSAKKSAGIAPRSSYIRVIGDFARWGDRVVFGCDDTAKNEFFNTRRVKGEIAGPGVSQSNLWFLEPSKIDQLGAPIGRGAVWLRDDVKAKQASDAFLFSGFEQRMLHLTHQSGAAVTFSLEVDKAGNGTWTPLRKISVAAGGYEYLIFKPSESGTWIRLVPEQDCLKATAFFQFSSRDRRTVAPARPAGKGGGLIWAHRNLMLGTEAGVYELDENLRMQKSSAKLPEKLSPPKGAIEVDAASVIYVDEKGKRWRLPKNKADVEGCRVAREVSTERDLLLAHGTFYELPSNNAGGIAMVRPVCTHNLPIRDFCSWRGFTVLSGLPEMTLPAGAFVGTDEKLWLGASDDLWQFGKAVGDGGPWMNTAVAAGVPSDPYLFTGYDQKTLKLSHQGTGALRVRVELDLSGFGDWVSYRTFSVEAGKGVEHRFPSGFHAYWIRTVAQEAATVSAQLLYR
jgi:hypothetical protein